MSSLRLWLIEGLTLPDPDDRHVLAAAIAAKVQIIVTANIKHFPRHILDLFDMEALRPDDFLYKEANANITAFLGCVRAIRNRLKNPPLAPTQYLSELEAQGLPKTASLIRAYAALI